MEHPERDDSLDNYQLDIKKAGAGAGEVVLISQDETVSEKRLDEKNEQELDVTFNKMSILKGIGKPFVQIKSPTSTSIIAQDGSAADYEQFGDGPEIISAFTEDEFLHGHPEGFMASLQDKSEEDVEELIKKRSGTEIGINAIRLDTILPEIREKIWKMLPFADISNLRLTCKKFQREIDEEIGIQLYLVDTVEDSFRLAITTVIKRLVIVFMEMSSLCKLIPHNPYKLRELKIQGSASRDAIHEILLRCSNVEVLEIMHSLEWAERNSVQPDGKAPAWGSLKDWAVGNLFYPEAEIRYSYGCFKKLLKIQFHSSDDSSSPSINLNLLQNGLLPILNCTNSYGLTNIDIKMCITTPEESKMLTDALFQLFLRARNLKEVHVHHYRSDSYTFEPLPNVDQSGKPSHSALSMTTAFSEHRPMPQFHILDLEMPEHVCNYFDWVFLLKSQRQLRLLKWDVGGNYWLYPIQGIQQSGKTLENLTLRMIRCYPIETGVTDELESLSMGNFHELISLKYFHLIGMELSTSQFCRMDMLPKKIENLQIESFQITPEQLFVIHTTLTSLKFLSLNHWNVSRDNFIESLKVIGKIIEGNNGKYRALTFLEKSMYSAIEELSEMNGILNIIKEISTANNMVVDEVSGDNGIGFVLVVGASKSSFASNGSITQNK